MLKYYDNTASEWKKVSPNVLGNNSVYTNQKPTGAINGTNTLFTLGTPYQAGTLEVYKNGIYLSKLDGHYTETDPEAGTFTMAVAPVSTDIITANYQRTLINSGNADTVDGFHASATPEANKIPVLDENGKLPDSANYTEYSLEEKIVGKWLDGRPIYRKVIDCGYGPNSGAKSVSHGITNIGRIINLYGSGTGDSEDSVSRIYPVNITGTETATSTIGAIRMQAGNAGLTWTTTYNASNERVYMVIEYLKIGG